MPEPLPPAIEFTYDGVCLRCEMVSSAISGSDINAVTDARWHVELFDEWRIMRACTPDELAGNIARPAFDQEVVEFVRTWAAH